ncbi:MAG: hypothetical protein ACLP01_07990 [Solirubrobacteraceae bacterium]
MFEHDFSDHALGAESLSPYEEQEIEQEAALYDLTPSEVIELEEETATIDSMPPAEGEQYEQELVEMEDQQAEETMNDTMDQAESFDNTLTSGD